MAEWLSVLDLNEASEGKGTKKTRNYFIFYYIFLIN